MRKIPILIAVIALSAIAKLGHSQIIDPKKVVVDESTSRANSNITSTIDNGVGKAEGAIKGLFKKKKKAGPAPAPVVSAPAVTPPPTVARVDTLAKSVSITAYNNYDFIPGDKIVFSDDMLDDQDGEFPAHWNLGAGQGVVNTVAGRKALLLTDGNYAHVSPLIKSPSYLTDPFTIEFDTYSNGGYPPKLYFYNTNAEATGASNDLADIVIGHADAQFERKSDGFALAGNYPADIAGENFMNKWHHIAIAYKKNQLKVYVDQYRVLVIPNLGITPHAFDIEGIGDATNPIVIANFRLANGGGMNMLGKKFTDAKIITHGINFDIDKATIKPESMGTLNMIVGILKDNPDLKFEIDGHTDNTGTPAHNLTLSQQRANAVKNQLIAMGIDGSRLTSKGFGDTKPMTENLTPVGKANNRRVEFVKQ